MNDIPKPKTSMLTDDLEKSSAEVYSLMSGASISEVLKENETKDDGLHIMKCHVLGFEYDFVNHTGVLYMADWTCCDMIDCVTFFLRIDRHVKAIQTMSGEKPDIKYWLRDNGKWDGGFMSKKKVS